jgi:hypothetical protein
VYDYTKALIELGDKVNVSPDTRLQFYILGLKEPIRTKVGKKKPTTFDKAEELALQYERDSRLYQLCHTYKVSDIYINNLHYIVIYTISIVK